MKRLFSKKPRTTKSNESIYSPETERYEYYEVIGAGKIEISKTSGWLCGNKTGFGFGVEWGQYGFTGGVLSEEEALRLAEHILKELDIVKLRKYKLQALE